MENVFNENIPLPLDQKCLYLSVNNFTYELFLNIFTFSKCSSLVFKFLNFKFLCSSFKILSLLHFYIFIYFHIYLNSLILLIPYFCISKFLPYTHYIIFKFPHFHIFVFSIFSFSHLYIFKFCQVHVYKLSRLSISTFSLPQIFAFYILIIPHFEIFKFSNFFNFFNCRISTFLYFQKCEIWHFEILKFVCLSH